MMFFVNPGKFFSTKHFYSLIILLLAVFFAQVSYAEIEASRINLVKTASILIFSRPGQTITYKYLVTNTGRQTLHDVTVTDPHTGLSAISCPIRTLVPGASETCTASYTTTQADVDKGRITNTGTATGDPSPGFRVSDNSTLTIPALVISRINVIKKSSPSSFSSVGQVITYSYVVKNIGNVSLSRVSVTDPHPRLSKITCPTTALAPGASQTCTATYTTTQADLNAGRITNTATASGNPPSGLRVSDTGTLIVPANISATISLIKSASPTSFSRVGERITYSYLVTNSGNVTLTSVDVADPHRGLSRIICLRRTLSPGESQTCRATYTTTQADLNAGNIRNTGTASGRPPLGLRVTDDSTVNVPAVVVTNITLTKSASPLVFSNAGQVINYSYLVTNKSNVTLTNVTVIDPHAGLSSINCPRTTLSPNASQTCRATYTTTQADVTARSITNTARATGRPPSGPTIISAPSTVTVQGAALPDISLTKSSSPSTFGRAGEIINYSYLITNNGRVTLNNIRLIDPHVGLSAIACPFASLTPGASQTCHASYTTTQADLNAGAIQNTATVSGTPPSGPPVTADSSLTVPAIVIARINLTKTALPTTFSIPGVVITYSYNVKNIGNVPVTNVSVKDDKKGLSSVNCPTTILAPQANLTCTATYRTTQADVNAGNIQNTATASGQSPTGTVIVDTTTLTVPATVAPSISINKSSSPTIFAKPGVVIAYNYLVTNTGNVTLTHVKVTDPHPNLSAISCPTSVLLPNASTTCTANYTTTQADVNAGSVQNTATAQGTPPSGPPVSEASTLTIPSIVDPGIDLTKSASLASFSRAGEPVTYFYVVKNSGNVPLTSVSVTDTHAGLSPISCPTTTLAPNGTQTCTATYITTQTDVNLGRIKNTATASGQPPSGPRISEASTLTIPAIVSPGVSLTKTSTPTSFNRVGTLITYSYLVRNTGNVTLTNVMVSDPQPRLTPITCPSTLLAPGATQTCTATYTTTQADVNAGNITNNGTVSAKSPSGLFIIDNSTLTVPANVSANISLIKFGSPTSFSRVGERINYSYFVTNTGNVTLTSIVVNDSLVGLSKVNCPTPTLQPGVSQTCTAEYTTTAADVSRGMIQNIANASGKPPTGARVSDDASVTIPLVVITDLTLTKSASPIIFSTVGQVINYAYLVTNRSNVTLSNVNVVDPHPGLSAISCPSNILLPSMSQTCTATYSITQADLDKGTITNTARASGKTSTSSVILSAPSSTSIHSITGPEIALIKSSSPTNFSRANVRINYSYLVTNNSRITLRNITVTDQQVGLSPITCPTTTLAPGSSQTCHASYTTTQADVNFGKIQNTGTATGQPPSGSTVSANSTLTVPALTNSGISLSKTSSAASFTGPGELINYAYLVKNIGNVTLTDLKVTDPHPGLSPIACPTTLLAPAASTTCRATYTTTQADVNAGSIQNTSTASANIQNSSGGRTSATKVALVVTDSSTLTIPVVIAASISLNKVSLPTSFSNAGVVIKYFYFVRNSGNVPLTNITVTDPQPQLSPITCPLATLAPGASQSCTAVYTTTQADMDAGKVENTSSVTGVSPSGPVVSDVSTLTVPANFDPGIQLSKSASKSSFSAAGETIIYSYLVTNVSNVILRNITVTDPHQGLSRIFCPQNALIPGASQTCTATYVTTESDVNAGSISNSSTAAGKPPIGPNAFSLPATLTINFKSGPGSITVVKIANGGNATFQFISSVSNARHFVLKTTQGRAETRLNVNPGNYTLAETNIPFGWKLTNLQCNGVSVNGSSTNVTVRSGQNVTCTFTNTLEVDVIRQKTQEQIRTFLNNRAHLILTNQPDRRRIVERLSRQARSTTQMDLTPSVSGRQASLTLASTLHRALSATVESDLDIWTEAHVGYFDDHLDYQHNHTGQFGLLYLGTDYLFTPSILAGILLEIDFIDEESNFDSTVQASGTGWLIGPYLSARIINNLDLHTRAAWGGSSNTINPFGIYHDQFTSTRSLYNAELMGTWIINALRVSPTLGVTYFIETQQSFTNSIDVFIPSQTIYLGQVNFGPEFGYEYITSRGYFIAPRLRLQGLYYFKQSVYTLEGQNFIPNKLSAMLELGAEIRLHPNVRLYPLIGYNGIGDNLHAIQGQVQLDVKL